MFTLLLKKRRKKISSGYLFIVPGVAFVLFLTIYPLVNAIKMSFFNLSSGNNIFVGFLNYQKAFQDQTMWLSMAHSFYFTIFSVSLHFLFGLGLALLLNSVKEYKGSSICRGLLFLPWLFSSAVWCVTWQLILHPQFSILNEIFNVFGLKGLNWISADSLLPLTSLSIVNGWKFFPFHMIMYFAVLQSIPKELYEAASIDGASGNQKFFYITLPSLYHTIAIVLTIDTIGTFHYFDLIWILTQGGPMNRTEVLSTYIYRKVFTLGNFGYGSAMSVILIVILIAFITLYIKILLKGEFEG